MKRIAVSIALAITLVMVVFASTLASSANNKTETKGALDAPSVVVAVLLRSPDFTVREMKYRVFYNKGEVKRLPLNEYDFKSAFTDELMNALSEDKRMQWRLQSSAEVIDVAGIWDRKVSASHVEADRILLVDVQEYGAFLASLAADKFYMLARFKIVERANGKKIWEKKLYERIDLDGKIADMQADNQKGLKEGINKVLEKVCAKIAEKIREAKV